MKVYKIFCEWDTDLTNQLYKTKKAAMKELEAYDWLNLVEDTLENLLKENLVGIREIKVHE